MPQLNFIPAEWRDDIRIKQIIASDTTHNILVNSVFLPLFRDETKRFRHVNLKGSSGSGKTDVMALLLLYLAMNDESDTLIVRKNFADIHLSQFKILVNVINRHGWRGKYFDWNGNDDKAKIIHCLTNKSKIIPIGLKDSQKITSITGIKRIWVEEPIGRTVTSINEISRDDYRELDSRAREKGAQIFMTFNPISKNTWIYEDFYHKEKANKNYLNSFLDHHSTFLDNCFVDHEEVKAKYKAWGAAMYKIYGLGEWGIIRPDDPWWYNFDFEKMVVPSIEFKSHHPIYWRLDFNIDVEACSMSQIWPLGNGRWYKGIFDELPPVTGLTARIETIRTHPLFIKHRANSIFITDAADPRQPLNPLLTQVKALKASLNLMDHQLIKGRSNPSHVDSSTVSNAVLSMHHCEVAEGCKRSISDFVETKRKPDGGIDKKHNDPHYGDGDRYFDWHIMKDKTQI